MRFNPHITPGQVLTENEVNSIFGCQPMKGIRLGTREIPETKEKRKIIVIMSGSAKKKIYDDVWKDDVLYYNGADVKTNSSSEQTLDKRHGNNNEQLFSSYNPSSKEDERDLFLFVKLESNKCIYKGPVEICEKPYLDKRHDDPTKKVWIFPLKLIPSDSDTLVSDYSHGENEALKKSIQELYKQAKNKESAKQPETASKTHKASTIYYERDPSISAYVKKRAEGKCDLCGNPAPFSDKEGNPYLESHHIKWLSRGGADKTDNMAALCPNCHKRMHILDLEEDRNSLLMKAKEYQKKEEVME